MIKALLLLFEPAKTWDAISRRERGVLAVFTLYLLPAIVVAGGIEGWLLAELGYQPLKLGFASRSTVAVASEAALRYEIAQSIISVVTVFLLGVFLKLLLHSFHQRTPFRLTFMVMAYCYGQLLLLQALDGVPSLPTWLCRAVGAVLAVKALYSGLVRVIRPDPSTALGIYFLGALLLFAFAGISHFVCLQILEGDLLAALPVWESSR